MDAIEHERLSTLMKQVAELQRKVDFLLKHLNLEYQEATPDPVETIQPQMESLIRQGKVLDAIKLFQLETGSGLREAKEAVDKIEKLVKSQR